MDPYRRSCQKSFPNEANMASIPHKLGGLHPAQQTHWSPRTPIEDRASRTPGARPFSGRECSSFNTGASPRQPPQTQNEVYGTNPIWLHPNDCKRVLPTEVSHRSTRSGHRDT